MLKACFKRSRSQSCEVQTFKRSNVQIQIQTFEARGNNSFPGTWTNTVTAWSPVPALKFNYSTICTIQHHSPTVIFAYSLCPKSALHAPGDLHYERSVHLLLAQTYHHALAQKDQPTRACNLPFSSKTAILWTCINCCWKFDYLLQNFLVCNDRYH